MQKTVCPAFKSSSAHFFHCKYSTKPRGPHAVPALVPSHHAHQLTPKITDPNRDVGHEMRRLSC